MQLSCKGLLASVADMTGQETPSSSSIPFVNYARKEGEGTGLRWSEERNEANHKFGHRLIDYVTSRALRKGERLKLNKFHFQAQAKVKLNKKAKICKTQNW